MSIYVDIRIDGSIDEVWRLTQTPDQHILWDLRFTGIQYLPRPIESEPQQFLYATRIGFGLRIEGRGETVGQCDSSSGERTSALRFWSDDPKSLIREGAGYWKYIPAPENVRFLTSYDYQVRFGWLGKWFDSIVFRPLIGWATAWSFDRLRLWIEKGIHPAVSMQRSLIHWVSRAAVGFVWAYQGVVPKLLFQHPDELQMLYDGGISQTAGPLLLRGFGLAELFLGLAVLFWFHRQWPLVVTVALMVAALAGVAWCSPSFLVAAFNPVIVNVLMAAMAVVGLLAARDLPSARRCLRRPPEENT